MPYTKPLLFFLLLLISAVCSRPLLSSDLPVSDGVHTRHVPNYLLLGEAAEESCEQTYGFLPCTTTALGNLFLILAYGYIMFIAATYLSTGSELLLQILGPGIVGGLFIPVIGALPNAMLILVSGLSGSAAEAQSQVSVGIGLLAGSTVMLLTVIWGSCVVVGKCDIRESDSLAVDGKNEKGFNLIGTGVSTDIWTCYAARIMVISVLPFLVVQLPQILNSTSVRHLAVLIALIVSLAMLISYCLYQVFQPRIQKRRLQYAKLKHVMSGFLRNLSRKDLGRFMTDDDEPNKEVIHKLFSTIDANNDNQLSAAELRALVVGIRFDEIDLNNDDAVATVMRDFDLDSDGHITVDEFIAGISKWIGEAQRAGIVSTGHDAGPETLDRFHLHTRREHTLLGPKGPAEDEGVENVESRRKITIKAVLLLLLGTIIAAVFANPLVDAAVNFSDATSIPTFFISFIALPLAANSSESVSAIIFASRKKLKTTSLTFSALYGAVTVNNLLCSSVLLALVYVRGLTWDFSSEVLVIFIVCLVMGILGSFRTTFPLWTSGLAYLLYPFSLALVYALDYVFGWS